MTNGDHIICKKDYFINKKLIFKKNHTYQFFYMFESTLLSNVVSTSVYIVGEINNKQEHHWLTENAIYDYFCTKQEEREIKLNNLLND